MLAHRPGHPLDPDPAARAIHPPRGVPQKHLDPPQRHELEAARRQTIVARPRGTTHRAYRAAVGPGLHLDLQDRLPCALGPTHRGVHKGFELLYSIQDSLQLHPGFALQLHPGFALLSDGWVVPPSSQSTNRGAPPESPPPVSIHSGFRCNRLQTTHKFCGRARTSCRDASAAKGCKPNPTTAPPAARPCTNRRRDREATPRRGNKFSDIDQFPLHTDPPKVARRTTSQVWQPRARGPCWS